MYEWLEQELIGIEPALSEAKAKKSTDAGYGRVDKAACWLLLSRLYLNSEIYTGTAQWQKAKEYAEQSNKNPPTGSILWEKADGLPIKCYSWVTTGKLMLLTKLFYPYFKTV